METGSSPVPVVTPSVDAGPGGCVLLVEDDPTSREVGTYNLQDAGFRVDAVASGEEALESFSATEHSVVITDLRMPGIDGMHVLEEINRRAPEVPVLVITAYGSVDTAVQAMKAGAYDFIGKPFNREHLLVVVRRAFERRRMSDQLRTLRIQVAGVGRPIIAQSDAMVRALEIVDRAAPLPSPVLIRGETGTGKELVARRIHTKSREPEGPFLPVHCGAESPERLDAELFGVGPTPAIMDRVKGGTVFLDEVAELPSGLQVKLLTLLPDDASSTHASPGVRIVAATSADLVATARRGDFRSDLLYRLNAVEVELPPLRERREDIAPLVRHFVEQLAASRRLRVPQALLDEMTRRRWDGNVRELENTCERLVMLSTSDSLRVEDLPVIGGDADVQSDSLSSEWPPMPDEGLSLVDLEKRVIQRSLEHNGWNVSRSAAYLRVPRHILAYRMTKYGIARRRDDG